jgi:hypothetical protein
MEETYSVSEYRENFRKWFVDILDDLIRNKPDTAGAILLVVSFPLLERYLRAVAGKDEKRWHKKLAELFSPELTKDGAAEDFWNIYRNGLLHQVTLNQPGHALRVGEHAKAIEKDDDGGFVVDPVKFTERVLEIIDRDFDKFATSVSLSKHPHLIIQGTNTTAGGGTTLRQHQDAYKLEAPEE